MTRRRTAFTLVELLTVAFIIAVMVALMLPAIQKFRALAMKKKTEGIIGSIRVGVRAYKSEFGKLPPSEPAIDDPACPPITNGSGRGTPVGPFALLIYLNGVDGKGYWYDTSGNDSSYQASLNPTWVRTTVCDPRVSNVQFNSSGFLDTWGNPIEYFVAYGNPPRQKWTSGWPRPKPGQTCADIYPRACNAATNGSIGYYDYVYTSGTTPTHFGGLSVRIPVARWLDDSGNPVEIGKPGDNHSGYRKNWPYYAIPVQSDFLLESSGADSLWGSDDDVGDVG